MDQLSSLDPNYCYSVKELAFLWNMSPESIRRLFVNEPLVFKIQATGRRTYRAVRIPGKVALRVQTRLGLGYCTGPRASAFIPASPFR